MTQTSLFRATALLLALTLAPATALAEPEGWRDASRILTELDTRNTGMGDVKSVLLLKESRRDQQVAREALVYSRGADRYFVILITKPKTNAGEGYLRIDNNLFFYDAKSGRWDRRTDRERLAGTSLRVSDASRGHYAPNYEAVFVGEERVGKVPARRIKLTARPGKQVEFPVSELWVDTDYNVIKSTEYGASGKLMRTVFLPRYARLRNAQTGKEVSYPMELHVYDEVEKDRRTTMVVTATELAPAPPQVFTKAWLESKSR